MFLAHLINDPLSDPGVYVKLKHRKEALLFDMGELHNLSPRQILRISHAFLSHTHMDHFIGFDHLLRLCLGRDTHIRLFGPPGFIKNVEGKLAGYTWNLVTNYTNEFLLSVTELGTEEKISVEYRCRKGFKAENRQVAPGGYHGVIVERPDFVVRSAALDHRIPSLAYVIEERQHINIMKNALSERGLVPGPWLEELKDGIRRNDSGERRLAVPQESKGGTILSCNASLGMLKEELVRISPGKKICYIADARYSRENVNAILSIAHNADILFIEASFLEEDARMAAEKYHLTAHQAGCLAKEAGAKQMVIFHLSPKYKGREHLLKEEAARAFTTRGRPA